MGDVEVGGRPLDYYASIGTVVETHTANGVTTTYVERTLDKDLHVVQTATTIEVTVVATGLNRVAARQSLRPERENMQREVMRTPIKLVRNATTGQPDFDAMANVQDAPMPTFGNLRSRGGRSILSEKRMAMPGFIPG